MINPNNLTDDQKEQLAVNQDKLITSKKKDLAKAKVVSDWLEKERSANAERIRYLTKEITRLENTDPVDEYKSQLNGGF